MADKITVTKSFIPPIEEYTAQVKKAMDNEWLTNRGELVLELEQKLDGYLGLSQSKILCTNNGTVPLQIALKVLGQGGEIITTPFSYVATTSSIVWEGCTPVFVDIDPVHLTIDETKIEAAITDRTTCILATHVFGNPCDVNTIQKIADKHKLKVIYDAAHCFGVKLDGKSIFEYGDVSTCSFHATKLFHTGEGGALFCKDKELFNTLYYSHNFGHDGPLKYHGLGINGKMSELNAAMGLAVLPHMKSILFKRKAITQQYISLLEGIPEVIKLPIRANTDWNYSYFPVIFSDEKTVQRVENTLRDNSIFPRRYFYPSLNTLPYLKEKSCPISEGVARNILCLPLHHEVYQNDIKRICSLIIKNL